MKTLLKKLMAVTLTLSMMLGVGATAFADTGGMSVDYDAGELWGYDLVVPEALTFDQLNETKTGSVGIANQTLKVGEKIAVTISSEFKLVNENDPADKLNFTVKKGSTTLTNGAEIGKFSDATQQSLSFVFPTQSVAYAENYEGNVVFESALAPKVLTTSWAEIKTVANQISKDARLSDGNLDDSDYTYILKTYGLSIGDEKVIAVGGTGAADYTVRIIGFNHDPLTSPTSAQGTYAGITFEFKNAYSVKHRMNATSTNSGSWAATEMRTYLQGDFMSYLPSSLQSNIATVKKITAATYNGTTNQTTNDTLFLLASKEIFSDKAGGTAGTNTASSNLTEWNGLKSYKYYVANQGNSARIKTLGNVGAATPWYLRSLYYNTSTFINYILFDGSFYTADPSSSYGVSPAFCL